MTDGILLNQAFIMLAASIIAMLMIPKATWTWLKCLGVCASLLNLMGACIRFIQFIENYW